MATAKPRARTVLAQDILAAPVSDTAFADTMPAALDDLVDVVVPKAFKLTTDGGAEVEYRPGTYPMPQSHAEHWFTRAQGVTVYVPAAQQKVE